MKKQFKGENKIVLIYIVIGLLWIYFSDKIVFLMSVNVEVFNNLQSFKGVFYVLITAVLLYYLISQYMDNLRSQKKEVSDLNEQLTAYNEELMAMNEELDQSLDELNEMNKKFISIINVVSDLKKDERMEENEFLSYLLENAVNIVSEADYGKIYLIENGKCKFIDAVGHDINILKKIEIEHDKLFYYDESGVFSSKDYSFDLEKVPEKFNEDFNKALKPIKESMYINITVNEMIVGRMSLDIAEDSAAEFKNTTKKIMESFATLASSFFAFKHYDNLQNKFTRDLISSIIEILEIYDNYTKGHSENVAALSARIAEKMGLSKKIISDTYWAGMVHDIGKMLVPINILNKNGKLTEEEYQLIKKHPVWGSDALSKSDSLKHISKYVLYHHERWDGGGYPEAKKMDEIPLVSQIISVADSWDAMRSERSYREPLTKTEAIAEIEKNRGKQFSPQIIDIFLPMIKDEDFVVETENINESNSQFVDQHYFKYLFEQSFEGIVILDKDFNIKKCNDYFLDMFGFNKNEIIGQPIKDVVVPAEKNIETNEFMEIVKNNNKVNSRSYREKKNGEKIEVSIQAFKIEPGKGESAYYIIYKDLSELKNIEKKYKRLEEKYRSLFENYDVVMLIIDPKDGQIIDANPAAENFYGWSREILKTKKISEINTLNSKEINYEMQNARLNNKSRFLFQHRIKSGEVKDVEVYSQPIQFENEKYLYSIVHEMKNI